jgi:virginiamycin A acetyltransferase
MLIAETHDRLTVRVTKLLAKALAERRIFRRMMESDSVVAESSIAHFGKEARIEPYTSWPHGGNFITMGAFSFSRSGLPVGTSIGRYCSISVGVEVVGFHHPIERLSTASFTFSTGGAATAAAIRDAGMSTFPPHRGAPQKPMPTVCHDVWIGAHVTLAGGITIGIGAIVAARAVVTKSVEPYMIVGGNPARPIRRRFPDAVCERLLASEWWRYRFTDFHRWNVTEPTMFLDMFDGSNLEPYEPNKFSWCDMKALCEELR